MLGSPLLSQWPRIRPTTPHMPAVGSGDSVDPKEEEIVPSESTKTVERRCLSADGIASGTSTTRQVLMAWSFGYNACKKRLRAWICLGRAQQAVPQNANISSLPPPS